MINKLIRKIGFICLGLASLALAGCFHVPDEDWLPSRNKVKTGDLKKDVEFEQAVDSFMDGINSISSEWNEMNKEDDVGVNSGKSEEFNTETENVDTNNKNNTYTGEVIDNEDENQKSETISEEAI